MADGVRRFFPGDIVLGLDDGVDLGGHLGVRCGIVVSRRAISRQKHPGIDGCTTLLTVLWSAPVNLSAVTEECDCDIVIKVELDE